MNQCACKMGWDKEKFWHIVYCPMHENAPEFLEACKDATALRGLVEKVEWMKRHADDLRSDCNEGSILETEMQINAIMEKIRAAIARAEGGD